MTERRAVLALVSILALVVAALGVLLYAIPAPTSPKPRPTPRQAPAPPVAEARAAPGGRVSLPRPETPAPRPRSMDPNTKYALNDQVEQVVTGSRAACLVPYVDGLPDPVELEFVLDVVLVDGDVADFGIRVPGGEAVPTLVVQCLADVVWGLDWPHFDDMGPETRLQRTLHVKPSTP